MQASFELFDHTADIGIRVHAPTLAELLMPATQGLYTVIGELAHREPTAPTDLDMREADPALLLHDYLTEMLFLFERRKRIAVAIEKADFDENHLAVTILTAPINEQRSAYHREVKAITYHELGIQPIPGGYEATIIVDI